MQIEKRTLNWFPKESAYDLAQAQREKRKAVSQAYIEETASLASSFATTRDDLVSGMAEIAAQVALARISKTA